MRVGHVGQAVRCGELVEACEPVEDGSPVGSGELEPRRPGEVADDGRDDERPPGLLEQRRDALGRGERLRVGGGVVQDDREEAADEREAVPFEQRADRRRVVSQVAVGSRLCRPDAELAHLREHTVGSKLGAPAGYLADAPGDRPACESVEDRSHGRRVFGSASEPVKRQRLDGARPQRSQPAPLRTTRGSSGRSRRRLSPADVGRRRGRSTMKAPSVQPLVEGEPGEPGRDQTWTPRRRLEDVRCGVVSAGGDPVCEQDREERHEHRSQQQEKALVADEVDHESTHGRGCGDEHEQELLGGSRDDVLDRHGGRVHVRERLVRLGDEQGEETDQPTPWSTLIPVGRYEPRWPSGARMSTIPGTRASAPIAPATASMRLQIRQPTRIATSASGSDRAGTRAAPATMTRSETPRFPQRRPVSRPLRTRRRSGTGSIPQLPSISSGSIERA